MLKQEIKNALYNFLSWSDIFLTKKLKWKGLQPKNYNADIAHIWYYSAKDFFKDFLVGKKIHSALCKLFKFFLYIIEPKNILNKYGFNVMSQNSYMGIYSFLSWSDIFSTKKLK